MAEVCLLLLVRVLQGCEQNAALNNCCNYGVCYQASVASNDKKMVSIIVKGKQTAPSFWGTARSSVESHLQHRRHSLCALRKKIILGFNLKGSTLGHTGLDSSQSQENHLDHLLHPSTTLMTSFCDGFNPYPATSEAS